MANGASVEASDGSGAGQSPDARVGQVLQERYRILASLGKGGMGTVYRAERLKLGRVVAIKFLHDCGSKDLQLVKRFEVEARAMSRLSHPNCVSVIDFGVQESPYLVMELVAGKTLLDTIREGIVPAGRALAITRQVLDGLAHAHGHGIIHRDVKPENILLERTPGFEDHVRIVDFGLAKLLDSEANLTQGLAVGTPNYMAPEQMGPGAIDGRTDVYAVSIVLFEMLTGRRPFAHEDIAEVFRRQLHMPPPPLRQASPREGYSAGLEAVLLRAMAKSPDDRFATAASFAAALDSVPEAGRSSTDGSHGLDATVHAGSQLERAPVPATNATTEAPPIVESSPRPGGAPVSGRAGAFARGLAGLRGALGRRRMVARACLAGITAALVAIGALWRAGPGQGEPLSDRPAASPLIEPLAGAGDQSRTAEFRALLKAGNQDRALRLLNELRGKYPADAGLAALQAEIYFEKRWWSEGVASYRDALEADPARAGDPILVGYVIRSLQSPRFHLKAAVFLRELGEPVRPFLEQAAREDDSPGVRSRAASLLENWHDSPTRRGEPTSL